MAAIRRISRRPARVGRVTYALMRPNFFSRTRGQRQAIRTIYRRPKTGRNRVRRATRRY